MCFKISASRHAKLKSSWFQGVWLGRDSTTNDHVVGSSSGEALRVRTVWRTPRASQWQLAPLMEVKGIQSSPSGSGELDTKFILSEDSLSFSSFKSTREPVRDEQQAAATSSGGGSRGAARRSTITRRRRRSARSRRPVRFVLRKKSERAAA